MQDLDKPLIHSTQEVLRDIFGEKAEEAIFYYLEKNHNIAKLQIAEELEAFEASLKDMFGTGSLTLVKLVVKHFYSKIGLLYEEREGWKLIDYLRYAKEKWRETLMFSKEKEDNSEQRDKRTF